MKRIFKKIDEKYWNFIYRCQRFKRGYSWRDTNEICDWFVETLEPMLKELRNNYEGNPAKYSRQVWLGILDKMIEDLHMMDIENSRSCQLMNESKDEFFKLFSKYFYFLWN